MYLFFIYLDLLDILVLIIGRKRFDKLLYKKDNETYIELLEISSRSLSTINYLNSLNDENLLKMLRLKITKLNTLFFTIVYHLPKDKLKDLFKNIMSKFNYKVLLELLLINNYRNNTAFLIISKKNYKDIIDYILENIKKSNDRNILISYRNKDDENSIIILCGHYKYYTIEKLIGSLSVNDKKKVVNEKTKYGIYLYDLIEKCREIYIDIMENKS